jgi:hypothetical protein
VEEIRLSLAFLKSVPIQQLPDSSTPLPLIVLAQSLFASSEFLFID